MYGDGRSETTKFLLFVADFEVFLVPIIALALPWYCLGTVVPAKF